MLCFCFDLDLLEMAAVERVATKLLQSLVGLSGDEHAKWFEIESVSTLAESVLYVLKNHPKKDAEGSGFVTMR